MNCLLILYKKQNHNQLWKDKQENLIYFALSKVNNFNLSSRTNTSCFLLMIFFLRLQIFFHILPIAFIPFG